MWLLCSDGWSRGITALETTESVGSKEIWVLKSAVKVTFCSVLPLILRPEFLLPALVLSPSLLAASPSPVRDHPTPVLEHALIPLTPSPAACRTDDTGDWQLLLLNLEGR